MIHYAIEKTPAARPYVDVKSYHEATRKGDFWTLDAIIYKRRLLVSFKIR